MCNFLCYAVSERLLSASGHKTFLLDVGFVGFWLLAVRVESIQLYKRSVNISSNHSVNHVPPRIGGGGGSTRTSLNYQCFCFYERIVQRLYPNLLRVQPAYKPIWTLRSPQVKYNRLLCKSQQLFSDTQHQNPTTSILHYALKFIYTPHLILSFLSVWGSGSWLCVSFLLYPFSVGVWPSVALVQLLSWRVWRAVTHRERLG